MRVESLWRTSSSSWRTVLLLHPGRPRRCGADNAAAMSSSSSAAPQHRGNDVLLACNVYVSEGQDEQVIQQLQAAASGRPGVLLAWTFVDRPYHRTGFTLTSWDADALGEAVVALSAAALQRLDLRRHVATHPRLGAVDHISLHPVPAPAARPGDDNGATGQAATTTNPTLEEAPRGMAQAVAAARRVAERLSQEPWRLPVYLYGFAHPSGPQRQLADVRRALGYFKPQVAASSQASEGLPAAPSGAAQVWQGALGGGAGAALEARGVAEADGHLTLPEPPDYGPGTAHPAWGVLTLGARPWMANFNVPLAWPPRGAPVQGGQEALLQAGRKVARRTSQRGGGLPAVEAMALVHDGGTVEVACNLLDPARSSAQDVQALVDRLAGEHGLSAGRGYQTNLTAQELLSLARERLGDGWRIRLGVPA